MAHIVWKIDDRAKILKNHWLVRQGFTKAGLVLKIVRLVDGGAWTEPCPGYSYGISLSNRNYEPDEAANLGSASKRTFYVNVSQQCIYKYPCSAWLGAYKIRAHTLEEAYQIMETAKWEL